MYVFIHIRTYYMYTVPIPIDAQKNFRRSRYAHVLLTHAVVPALLSMSANYLVHICDSARNAGIAWHEVADRSTRKENGAITKFQVVTPGCCGY